MKPSSVTGQRSPSGLVSLLGQAFGVTPAAAMTSIGSNGESVTESVSPATPSTNVMASASTTEPSTLVSTSPTPTTNSTASAGTAVTMPDDVRKWLEHLERIEEQRKSLAAQQLGEAMSTLTGLQASGGGADMQGLANGDEDAIPDQRNARSGKVRDQDTQFRTTWESLLTKFLSVSPPSECASIQKEYATALRETGAMIVEIEKAIEKSSTDQQGALSALYGMQGRSDSRIGKPCRASDNLVESLCGKYNTKKWFSIKEDIGSGLMGKML